MAGAHDQRVVAHEVLQVMDLPVVGAVGGIGRDDLGFLPGGLEVVLRDAAAVADTTSCMILRPSLEAVMSRKTSSSAP